MFGRIKTANSWHLARLIFTVFGLLVFAPLIVLVAIGAALLAAPVVLVGLPTRTVESWKTIARWLLIGTASAVLAPAAFLLAVAGAFFMAPVALICIPFMLPVFFELAAHERREHQAHVALQPAHAH